MTHGAETVDVPRLLSAIKAVRNRFRDVSGFRDTGLSITQFAVLRRLVEGGPQRVRELATAEQLPQHVVSETISHLRNVGYATMHGGRIDPGRAMAVHTETGRHVIGQVMHTRDEWAAKVVEQIAETEGPEAVDVATRILEQLAAGEVSVSPSDPRR